MCQFTWNLSFLFKLKWVLLIFFSLIMISHNDNLIFYSDSFKDSHFSGTAVPIWGIFAPKVISNLFLVSKLWVPPCTKSWNSLEFQVPFTHFPTALCFLSPRLFPPMAAAGSPLSMPHWPPASHLLKRKLRDGVADPSVHPPNLYTTEGWNCN